MLDEYGHECLAVNPDGPPRVYHPDGTLAFCICRECGEPYGPEELHADKHKPDGVATICRECYAEQVRTRYQARRPTRSRSRRQCTAQFCSRPHKAKGLCTAHYQRAYREGTLS